MTFYLIGADCRTASLDMRELMYRERSKFAAFWAGYPSQEAAILCTCNRIEIYAIAKDVLDVRTHIGFFLERFPQFVNHGYIRYDTREVFRHAIRLACGLESQLKGESEILKQLDGWRKQDSFPAALGRLWQEAIPIAREIRSRSGMTGRAHNIASIIFDDLAWHIGDLTESNIIIVGTGKIAELFAISAPESTYLKFVANKNRSRADRLANISHGDALGFDKLSGAVQDADALVSATSSPHLVLGPADLLKATAGRDRPLYIYDVAVPRDIAPSAREIDGIILKNIDDIYELYEKRNDRLCGDPALAEYLAEEKVREYEGKFHGEYTESRY